MFKSNWRLVCLLVCCALVFGSTPAYSWCGGEYDLNETIHNGVGPANDLEKYFGGKVRIYDWYSDRFTECQALYNVGEDETTIRWYNPDPTPVVVCEYVRVCFSSDDPIEQKYEPTWTLDASLVGIAGPGLSFEVMDAVYPNHNVIISGVGDQSVNYTLNFLKIGVVDDPYPIDSLFGSYVDDIPWQVDISTPIPLAVGEQLSYPDFDVPVKGGLIFYAEVFKNDDPGNVVEYVGQYASVRATPSLTGWGLLVLAILVLASGIWVVIQRRKTARVRV